MSGDTISQSLPFVDLVTATVETQISCLGTWAASPCDKVEAAARWAPRPHASKRAVAAASLPCEDDSVVRTKDKPFILTARTHMGILEKNGTSLVLHLRGYVNEGDKPPNTKKPIGKNGCNGRRSACNPSLNSCNEHIGI